MWPFPRRARRRRADTVALLRERLERFHDLVDTNNRVLELIAQAGEMLSGEYVFDIQYLRALVRNAKTCCTTVIDDLNSITDERYPELRDTLAHLAAEMEAILDGRVVVAPAPWVVTLDELDEPMADVAGAKMARLGAVRRRLGMATPDGFAVTTYACQVFLEESGIAAEVEAAFAQPGPYDSQALAARSERLRQRVLGAQLPREIARAIDRRVSPLARGGRCPTLAVRSSALGEDGELSFAGQFRTVLGVTPERIHQAYLEVIASMYSTGVMSYRQERGLHPARGLMAVGCLCMVPARAGGVLYTLDPVTPDREYLAVAVVPGLGKPVVEGAADADRFTLTRATPHAVETRHVAAKSSMLAVLPSGRVEEAAVATEHRDRPAVSDDELHALAEAGLAIERYMKCAVDVEWAIAADGTLNILQARPLRLAEPPARSRMAVTVGDRHPTLMSRRGEVACAGVAAGPVLLVEEAASLDRVDGCVLVARTSTPRLAAALPHAAAVITDVGTTTSHLATIAREFRVPTIVDTGNATEILAAGRVVTVDADANAVYGGRVDELLHRHLLRSSSFEDTNEFRMLRRLLRRIAPLNLRDPQARGFTAAGCSTCHDIIRFAHEKAVQELAEGDWLEPSHRAQAVHRLDLELPLDLVLIDLGGGLASDSIARKHVEPGGIRSLPLRTLLQGLTTEGVWATDPTAMDPNAFMASATRAAPWLSSVATRPQHNLAIISPEYLNLNLRLGFHFNIVDAYMAESRNDNYIYFRFAGGVTELRRRARRAILLARILESFDFVVECKGDLVIGRVKKMSKEAMVSRMRMVGRLIGFTRQLDILLSSEEAVDVYVERFLAGRFGATPATPDADDNGRTA